MFGLGKKEVPATPPQNENLGQMLTDMMQDPQAHQDAFYKAFLTSNIFLMGETDDPAPGEKTMQGGDKIRVMQWIDPQGEPFIPIFTSHAELQRSLPAGMTDANYVAMSGYDALNLTQGQVPVAIDPANDHCLYLVPPQIAQILDYFDSLTDK